MSEQYAKEKDSKGKDSKGKYERDDDEKDREKKKKKKRDDDSDHGDDSDHDDGPKPPKPPPPPVNQTAAPQPVLAAVASQGFTIGSVVRVNNVFQTMTQMNPPPIQTQGFDANWNIVSGVVPTVLNLQLYAATGYMPGTTKFIPTVGAFVVGTYVQLKSGGPMMQVTATPAPDTCSCAGKNLTGQAVAFVNLKRSAVQRFEKLP